ncbi:redoxin domain-containing protein [Evansella sp. AB-P1]|uniref:TlpA family protein disulfide reductase n=1 Tax=Evansella sp. AB-P1 TaxID=3037653 RepID=UPI00241DBD3D|nr:redoxin domain-containing protein [Evansella sp. AB-P1]MDG5786177.1 redoxin domain-containing protein [Evansella sp. AB-P1]
MEEFIFYSIILLWCLFLFHSFLLFLLFRQFGEIYLSSKEGIAKDGVSLGATLPSAEAYSMINKKTVNIKGISNKSSIILFLSPNCKPCRGIIDDWNKTQISYSKDVTFVMVIVGEEKEVFYFNNKYKLNGEILWDESKGLFTRFKVRVTPFAFAIDRNGLINNKGLCGSKEQLDMYVQSIISSEEEGGKSGDRYN